MSKEDRRFYMVCVTFEVVMITLINTGLILIFSLGINRSVLGGLCLVLDILMGVTTYVMVHDKIQSAIDNLKSLEETE